MSALRVLLVDDEPLALRRLETLFGDIDGAEVVGTAATGEEAEARIAELRPDLVMLDISMPKSPPTKGRNWLRKIGRTTMKAAPMKLPMIDPSPPMITTKSNWKERSIEKARGSQEPR